MCVGLKPCWVQACWNFAAAVWSSAGLCQERWEPKNNPKLWPPISTLASTAFHIPPSKYKVFIILHWFYCNYIALCVLPAIETWAPMYFFCCLVLPFFSVESSVSSIFAALLSFLLFSPLLHEAISVSSYLPDNDNHHNQPDSLNHLCYNLYNKAHMI